jgi:hypothetical protein
MSFDYPQTYNPLTYQNSFSVFYVDFEAILRNYSIKFNCVMILAA